MLEQLDGLIKAKAKGLSHTRFAGGKEERIGGSLKRIIGSRAGVVVVVGRV